MWTANVGLEPREGGRTAMQLSSPTPAVASLFPGRAQQSQKKINMTLPGQHQSTFLFVQGRHREVLRETDTLSGTPDSSEGKGCEVT